MESFADVFAPVINMKILDTAAIALIFNFKPLKTSKNVVFIFDVVSIQELGTVVLKSNKISAAIIINRGDKAVYIAINKLY